MNFMDWSIKPQLGANTPLDFFSAINQGTPTVDFANMPLPLAMSTPTGSLTLA
jgi:hypothetical protein